MAVLQALSAMDAVRRRWARELGIEAAELAVVMSLFVGEPLGPAEVAWRAPVAHDNKNSARCGACMIAGS